MCHSGPLRIDKYSSAPRGAQTLSPRRSSGVESSRLSLDLRIPPLKISMRNGFGARGTNVTDAVERIRYMKWR